MNWYTIKEFAQRKPITIYHKEMEPYPDARKEEEFKNVHVLVRKEFDWKKSTAGADAERLILRITADDYYKLYINGSFVCMGPAPGYPEQYFYNEVDITDYIIEGTNTIGVHLYYQGLINRVFISGDARMGLAAEFVRNGCVIAACDETWKYKRVYAYSGTTFGYDTQFVENFDERLYPIGWEKTGYEDSDWENLKAYEYASYNLSLLPSKMLSVYPKKPERIVEKAKNHYFLDFGEEIVGTLRVRASGKEGDKVILRFGEETVDGDELSVRYQMRCFCQYEDIWTLAGGESVLDQYDYKGFRYAEVLADPGVKLGLIEAVVRHYPIEDAACTVTCSDERLEQVFRICKNGVKYGTQEGYLDCPTREKGQYLGDGVITAHSQAVLTGSTELLEKALSQYKASGMIDKGLMTVVPGGLMQEIADFSLLFPELVLTGYRLSGKKELLKEYAPVVKDVLDWFSDYEREDGLIGGVKPKWNLVDWPSTLRDNYDFPLPKPVGEGVHCQLNALYLGAMKAYLEIGRLLGAEQSKGKQTELRGRGSEDMCGKNRKNAAVSSDTASAEAGFRSIADKFEKAYAAFRKAFYRPEQKLFADSETTNHCAMHSNIYPMYFGLLPEEAAGPVRDLIMEKGLNCGVMTSFYVLKGLARYGYHKEVYELLVNETEHGWINMVRDGGTTCMEAWGKMQKDNTSLCHPWASAPISVIVEDIAGFQPDPEAKEGYRFEPHIPEGVELAVQLQFHGTTYLAKNGQLTAVTNGQ